MTPPRQQQAVQSVRRRARTVAQQRHVQAPAVVKQAPARARDQLFGLQGRRRLARRQRSAAQEQLLQLRINGESSDPAPTQFGPGADAAVAAIDLHPGKAQQRFPCAQIGLPRFPIGATIATLASNSSASTTGAVSSRSQPRAPTRN